MLTFSQISLRLNDHPKNKDIPKDYLLQRQNVDSKNSSFAVQNSYIFSEKDLPGQKNRVDEIFGETRSLLYESVKREARKKTYKKKWEPYVRKTIPSMPIFFVVQLFVHMVCTLLTLRRANGNRWKGRGRVQLHASRKRRISTAVRGQSFGSPEAQEQSSIPSQPRANRAERPRSGCWENWRLCGS